MQAPTPEQREKLHKEGWGPNWEGVLTEPGGSAQQVVSLTKARVPGGWLCRTFLVHQGQIAVAMAFVPDPMRQGSSGGSGRAGGGDSSVGG